VQRDGATPAEVERAINKLLAGIAYRRDGSFAIAGQINEAIAVGDWTVYHTLLEKLKTVTPADVQRVAKTYCLEDQGTTGWFIPQAEAPAKATSSLSRETSHAAHARGPHYYRSPAGRSPLAGDSLNPSPTSGLLQQSAAPAGGLGPTTAIAPNIRRRTVAGLDVVTLKTSIRDVVTLRGVVGAGDVFNPPGNSAIADLAAGLLDKGTAQQDKFAVAALLEQAGATLAFGTDAHALNFQGKCLRKDLPLVLGLLAEQLRTPRFDAEEFAKLKKQIAGRFKRQMEDTGFRADGAFARAIFPAGHPNRPPAEEKYLADLEAATLDQVKAFHAAHYGPALARLILVGDVDEAAIERAVTAAFAGWTGGRALPAAKPAPALVAARTEKVAMPGKTSVSVVIGQPSGLRARDAGYQPLHMATSVLGSGFFSARLLDIIRNQEGLTYGIVAQLGGDALADGSWAIQATFSPELLDKGLVSTLRELRRLHATGVTAEELKNFKVTLTGSYQVTLATTGGLASAINAALQRGHGPEWIDEYPKRLAALTLDEVNAAIRSRLDPDRMITVLAGTLPEAK
jgi:zinc protease